MLDLPVKNQEHTKLPGKDKKDKQIKEAPLGVIGIRDI